MNDDSKTGSLDRRKFLKGAGAALGPLSVRRFPILSGFIVGFFAMPAHAPFASGMVASATPAAPAPLRNLRRSSDPVVLSSFTLPPSVRFKPPWPA